MVDRLSTLAGDAAVAHDGEHIGTWTLDGHRREVVRRLLDRGLSPNTLHLLLPELRDTIAGLAEPSA